MLKITVEGHSFDNEMAQDMVDDFKESIEEQIGEMRCPDHGEPPQIVLTGETVETMGTRIIACCERFRWQVERKLDDEI